MLFSGGIAPIVLNLAENEGEWSVFRFQTLYPREQNPRHLFNRRYVGPQSGSRRFFLNQ